MKPLIKRRLLTIEDIKDLSLLLNVGIDLKSALLIIENDDNSLVIESILLRLNNGEIIEQFINHYINKNNFRNLDVLLNFLPLTKSLDVVIKLNEYERKIKTNIIKKTFYPIMLVIITFLGIFIFNYFGFRLLTNMANDFNFNISTMNSVGLFINTMIIIMCTCLIGLIIFVIYSFKNKTITYYYLKLNNYLPSNIFNLLVTNFFVNYYLICLEAGLDTESIIGIMRNLKSKQIISSIAYGADCQFLAGFSFLESLNSKLLDKRLKRFLNIAYKTNKNNIMLKNYLSTNEKLIDRKLKSIISAIQVISYLLVGAGIYYIYQMLMVPLNILSNY